MAQLSEQTFQGGISWKSQAMYSDFSKLCGQMRLISHCMKKLILITDESGNMRSHMPILRSRNIHYAFCFVWLHFGHYFGFFILSRALCKNRMEIMSILTGDRYLKCNNRKSYIANRNLLRAITFIQVHLLISELLWCNSWQAHMEKKD